MIGGLCFAKRGKLERRDHYSTKEIYTYRTQITKEIVGWIIVDLRSSTPS